MSAKNTKFLFIKKYNIKNIIDVACGAFNWLKSVAESVDYYQGNDIVKRLIESNNKTYSIPGKIESEYGDIINNFTATTTFDSIIATDVFVHLPTFYIL